MRSIIVISATLATNKSATTQNTFANKIQLRYAIIQDQPPIYNGISFAEIPEPICNRLAGNYSEYVTSKAFKGDDGTFRIFVNKENRRGVIIFNKNGDILKIETAGYEKKNFSTNI